MGVIEFVATVLATWQIVEIWRHSSLLAGWRARVEVWDDRFPWGFAQGLLSCPYCLSVWVGWLIVGLLSLSSDCEPWLLKLRYEPYTLSWQICGLTGLGLLWVVKVLVWGLAISRAANLGNDITHQFCRTARNNRQNTFPVDDTEDEDTPVPPG